MTWIRKLIWCWRDGHNLVGVPLPEGWSWQTCLTCGERTRAYRPPKNKDSPMTFD